MGVRPWANYCEWVMGEYRADDDPYDKPWLSPVTSGECARADALANVQPRPARYNRPRNAIAPQSGSGNDLAPANGHHFMPSGNCEHCGVPWEDHQHSPVPCGTERKTK